MEVAAAVAALCPGLPGSLQAAYLPHLVAAMEEFHITTPARGAAFLAQVCHESNGLRSWVESLNYRADRLMQVWPRHFPTQLAAKRCAGHPERIANRVYAGRMGNGPEASGDGWRYRGRGPLQVTGRASYRQCGRRLCLPLEAEPDRVSTPETGFRVAGAYWSDRCLNALADAGDFEAITRKINGGITGQAQRLALYRQAEEALA